MVIRVHLMNTVKIKVPYNRIQELKADLRKWRVRHYPFRRQVGGMEIEMYFSPKINFILLKYPFVVDFDY